MSILLGVLNEEYERSCRIIDSLKAEIDSLPRGYISRKKINGKEYCYIQYREGGKVKSRYIRPEQVDEVKKQIARRKSLEKQLREIYEPFHLPIVAMNRRSAEMTKYACNDFLALKISYMNDIANLCELMGANVEDVANGMGYDSRIGANFLRAGIGFGGSCFPKDTKALRYQAEKVGYQLKTVEAAVEINQIQKIRLFTKARDRMITFKDLKVAVLGLSFKPGTDDLREAPSLENVNLLLKEGANIFAYDPVASENFARQYPPGRNENGTIEYVKSCEEALKDAHICFIFTEWKEIREIKPEVFRKYMKLPLVYDGRNLYNLSEMKKENIEYYSIGRPAIARE